MPYRHATDLKAMLDELAAATKAAKQAARDRARERAPLAKRIRDLKRSLDTNLKGREKWRGWMNMDDRSCESCYGQQWRDKQARIAQLDSDLLTAQLALAAFDNGLTTP
jgi:hypothetical protein